MIWPWHAAPAIGKLRLAAILVVAYPLRIAALGVVAAIVAVVSTVAIAAIVTISVAYVALVSCRYVLPAADRLERRIVASPGDDD